MSIDFSTLQGLTIPEGVVTEITDASGRVLWCAVKIITFTIRSTTYQAEEGMTWAEWYGSEYDTTGAFIDGDGKVYPDYYNIHGYLTGVRSSDVIIEGMAYTISYGGGSND